MLQELFCYYEFNWQYNKYKLEYFKNILI